VLKGYIPLVGNGVGESLAYTGPMLSVTLMEDREEDETEGPRPVTITATATEGRLQLLVRLNKLSLRHSTLGASAFLELPIQKCNPVKVRAGELWLCWSVACWNL
jgi:hypothetical protein